MGTCPVPAQYASGTLLSMEPVVERKSLGQVIRALRELDGLSRDELAARSGLGSDMIAKVEQGAKSPSASALNRIASTLGVSAVELSNRGLTWATFKDSPEASTALLRTIATGSSIAISAARYGAAGVVGAAGVRYAADWKRRKDAEKALRALLERRLEEANSVEDLVQLEEALDLRPAPATDDE